MGFDLPAVCQPNSRFKWAGYQHQLPGRCGSYKLATDREGRTMQLENFR